MTNYLKVTSGLGTPPPNVGKGHPQAHCPLSTPGPLTPPLVSYKRGLAGRRGHVPGGGPPLLIVCKLGQPPHLAHLPARCADASLPSLAPPAGPVLPPRGRRGNCKLVEQVLGPLGTPGARAVHFPHPPAGSGSVLPKPPGAGLTQSPTSTCSELPLGPRQAQLCISVSRARGSGLWPSHLLPHLDACMAGSSLPSVL